MTQYNPAASREVQAECRVDTEHGKLGEGIGLLGSVVFSGHKATTAKATEYAYCDFEKAVHRDDAMASPRVPFL